jgi:hypothetical protein
MVYQKKKTLYLINEGLSCLTIFKILLKILKKNRELVNKYKSDIIKFKKDKINQLSLNGILELRNTRINPKISTLLKKSNIKCFSLLSRPCIESGIICLGLFPKSELIISPLKVNNQEINNENDYKYFKESFGGSKNNLKKYWNIDNNIINKSADVSLNWNKFDEYKKISKLGTKHFNTWLSIFETYNSKINNNSNENIVLFCNEETILKFLKLIRNKKEKFQPKKENIESGSCFKIEMNINYQSSTQYTYDYLNFEKVYPTKFNYEPLIKQNNEYYYSFKTHKYLLYNGIDFNSLKLVDKLRCSHEKLIHSIFSEIQNKQNNQNKKNKQNNQNKQNKTENLKIQHIKSIGYNNIYEKLNKNLKKN